MKKYILGILIITFTFITGYSISSVAKSVKQPELKIAVIDIPQLIVNSDEVKNLKIEQEQKIKNIENIIEKAKIEMSKEKDPQKLAALEEKYRKEINKQKLAMDMEYNNKLIQIDNNIKTSVINKARSMHYNIILPKNTVLFGGDDITAQVAAAVK